MIAVTHCGKIGDFGHCLPICSWLYKTYGEKIIFVFPQFFPFMDNFESVLRLQEFTEDILYSGHMVNHYDVGGQPYKFNPLDYFPDLKISRYYNLGFRSIPDKFVPYFYAEEHDLGVDMDFVLNLDLDFKYSNDKIMCSEVMHRFLPHYEPIDLTKDFLYNLRNLAYAKERHIHSSSLSVFLAYAGIPYHFYSISRDQPAVNILDFDRVIKMDPKYLVNTFVKNANLLDIRSFDEDNKIISVYNQVYF